jgi:hypothetical protein
MFEKNKNGQLQEKLSDAAQNIGLLAMGTAMAVGFIEIAGHTRAVVPATASVSPAGEHQQGGDPMRREREETGPHYISYGAMHRTAGRSGSV